MQFDSYDDPVRAQRVYKSYEPEIKQWGLGAEAQGVISETKTADALDARLDLLVTNREIAQRGSSDDPCWFDDPDAQGYQSIARRILEDGS